MKNHHWLTVAAGACALAASTQVAAATVYVAGTTTPLTSYPAGTFDLGTHLPNYIGGTVGNSAEGTNLDGNRVYMYDINDHVGGPNGAAAQAAFNLLVWQFGAPKDSVRLYTHQDHYFGGPIDSFTASEVLEYSIWGCNSHGGVDDCKTAGQWSYLSDPTSFVLTPDGPVYTFAGAAAATVFRGGSAEFGLTNAYTQDYTFGSAYDFYAIRGSTIAMLADTADPELDAMVAFNRVDVPVDGIPEPETYALMLGGLAALGWVARRRKA